MSVENLLKTKIDIVEYIGRFTELRPKGSLYEGRCPIHGSDEGTPLVIYIELLLTELKDNLIKSLIIYISVALLMKLFLPLNLALIMIHW